MSKENEIKSEVQKAMDALAVQRTEQENDDFAQPFFMGSTKDALDILQALHAVPVQQGRSVEEHKKYEASANKVADTIMEEIAANKLDDGKLLGSVIATLVRRRLGDISVDGADICRSRGDQWCLVESCTQSHIKDIEDCAKDYIEYKFLPGENDWVDYIFK